MYVCAERTTKLVNKKARSIEKVNVLLNPGAIVRLIERRHMRTFRRKHVLMLRMRIKRNVIYMFLLL